MDERAFAEKLRSLWPAEGEAETTNEIIALADEAVRRHPDSPRLWCMRGNLIELGPEDCPHPLAEAERSYRQAVEIDPDFAEGYKNLGYFYWYVTDDPRRARPFLAKARAIKKR